MAGGSSTARKRSSCMICWVFAKSALTQANRGKITRRPCSRSKEGSRTMRFPTHASGPRCSRRDLSWWKNYNGENHYAHRERQDGRHSPSEVLRGVLGRTYPEEVLSRVLYATQFTRYLDKQGYVKFKHWRLFGENGLAGEEVSVWVYESTLKIEYQTTALALYSVQLSQD